MDNTCKLAPDDFPHFCNTLMQLVINIPLLSKKLPFFKIRKKADGR